MFEKFLNLIYPNVCGFCNQINKNSLCKSCEISLNNYYLNCIKDYTKDKTKYFNYLYSSLKYENVVRNKIISYKFGEASYMYKTFAKIIINNTKIYRFLESYDIITAVPMYKLKKNARGYNQSELVAKEIAKQANITFCDNILIKTKSTKVQSTLTKKQREDNVKGAFEVLNELLVNNKKIVLFDDIYTTGSTVNECARALKKAGANEIFVLTIAKD